VQAVTEGDLLNFSPVRRVPADTQQQQQQRRELQQANKGN